MAKYWLAGATEDEGNGLDRSSEWQRSGVWKLMWDAGDKPIYDTRLSRMEPGDRIAIKSMCGQGQSTIKIKAIGIIKEVSIEGRLVVVDWCVKNMSRIVPSKGCYGTLHGPFDRDLWTRRVFCL
jgi:hypothetical protein